MTMLDRTLDDTFHEASSPVLETERLILRAPRFEDAKRVAALASDRRVAENTARIPHPYSLADAKDWIGSANRTAGEASFLIDAGGEVIGACGLEWRNGVPEIGYWLGAPFWGNGYATEAARALIDHAFAEHGYPALHAGRPHQQSRLAACAGKMRLPMDRRRPPPHPRHQLLRAARPVPAGTRHLVLGQEPGPGAGKGGIARRDVRPRFPYGKASKCLVAREITLPADRKDTK